jgi:membrane fusion protein (multidrug efflux system)
MDSMTSGTRPVAPSPWRARCGTVLALAALLALAAACGGGPGGEDRSPEGGRRGGGAQAARGGGDPTEQPRVPVIVEQVRRTDMNAYLEASATLEAEERVEVVSEATGVVAEILVEEGDEVDKGQLLARLAYEELELAEARARSELERLEADFERSQRLARENLISEDEFQQIEFDLKRARIDWRQAKLELNRTRITAPIEGTISKRLIRVGALVNRNEVAYEIVDFASIVAPVFVSEQYLPDLYVDQRVILRAPALGQMEVEGHVERVSPVVDAESGTVEVTVGVSDLSRLRPGMFVAARLVLDTHEDTLAVSKKAVVYEDESPHLFVVDAGRAQRREVRLGYEGEELVEVTEGLGGDEWIVVVGQSGLKSDTRVSAENSAGEPVTFEGEPSPTEEQKARQPQTEEALS